MGRELEAITLHTPAEMDARARTAALTENFLPVELEGRLEANRLVRLRVTGLNAEGTLEAIQTRRAAFGAPGAGIRTKPFVQLSRANAILSVRPCARGDSG